MIDFQTKRVFKLKPRADYADRAKPLMIEGEEVVAAFKSGRDGVVFTDRRIIVVNVQGLTGSRRDFTSLPYRAISAWSVETAGTFDRDGELDIFISALGQVRFEFSGAVDMTALSTLIAGHVL